MDSDKTDGQGSQAGTTAEPGPAARPQPVGPALKVVPERRADAPPAAGPEAPSGNVSPIKTPGGGAPQPVGPAAPPGPPGAPQGAAAVRPAAPPATIRGRHRLAMVSFVLLVLLPVLLLAGYLYTFAQDQYASEAGFSVRQEEGAAPVDMLGGLSQLTGSASTDAEILYDFILSQDLVTQLDRDMDLLSIYGRNAATDPLFSLKAGATIEEKVDYWKRMMTIRYNEATGIIRLEVRAFTPEEAQAVSRAVLGYSSTMINRLAEVAREDATRYARAELARSADRLKAVRQALTEFRSRNQVVDPISDIQGQQGLLNNLQGQLAEALIELDVLRGGGNGADPRIGQIERRIEVIERRIAEERSKFGVGVGGAAEADDYAAIVAEYEGLEIDRTVAEEQFRSATIIFEAAQAEANRKSLYLAAHVEPTLAQGALYPRSALILALTGFFLMLGWSLMILIYYSIRDRR